MPSRSLGDVVPPPMQEGALLRLAVMDVQITTGSRPDIFWQMVRLSDHTTQSAYVCFVNVHMVVEAHRNPEFRAIVNGADMACADGLPVARSIGWFYGLRQPQIAGPDTVPRLLRYASRFGKRVFVLGSTDDVLEKFADRAAKEFSPDVICGHYSPPFRALTAEEDAALVQRINATGADMILVALGCPKQEKWMAAHRGVVKGCMFGVGYAIPVFAGVESRAPRWMVDSGMEWFFRLYSDPKRLLRRYMDTNTFFVRRVLLLWLVSRWNKLFGGSAVPTAVKER